MKIQVNPFDKASIDAAIKQVAEYKKDFLAKEKIFVKRLAEIGVSVATTGFALADYDGNKDVTVRLEWNGNRAVVIAEGETVGFIEFGTGIKNPEWVYSSIDIDIERTFTAAVNGVKWDGVLIPTYSSADSVRMNTLISKPVSTLKSADIAFIVDATGSMYDEIDFLKDDLLNIIRRASSGSSTELRTGALFYRDEGDDYVTRIEDFNKDPEKTLKFIRKQEAQGGGDYPEAVHTALEKALQDMSWEEGNYARIAFLLLDAPPHHQQNVIESLQKSIKLYAAKGIKIIPIAASGVDKNTEFILRLMAIFTDGTYTFITNHSGVGNDHIEPTIGEYQVEQLNDLIVRLIEEYTE